MDRRPWTVDGWVEHRQRVVGRAVLDHDLLGVAQTVTVTYATAHGTPDGSNYVGRTDTLTFSPGTTSQTVSFLIKPDAMVESVNETFYVRLSNPTNATIADREAGGTSVDDDDLDLDADPCPERFEPFGA